jgi:hypothetical protein
MHVLLMAQCFAPEENAPVRQVTAASDPAEPAVGVTMEEVVERLLLLSPSGIGRKPSLLGEDFRLQ